MAIDPDLYRLPDDEIPTVRVKTTARRKRAEGFYQIGESQFALACQLPGKALALYLLLLRQGVRTKTNTVRISTVRLREYGITRYQKRAAMHHLEEAGLIRADRCNGKNPTVTLLELETEA